MKVLEEGDEIEKTLTVSSITFERQKDTTSAIVAAEANTPATNRTTHRVNLIITASPISGSGFPVTKAFSLEIITDTLAPTPTNEVTGCAVSSGSSTSSTSSAASSAGITSCPATWTLVGQAGSAEAYCISARQTAGGHATIIKACYNMNAHLCTAIEWAQACFASKITGYNWGEYVGDGYLFWVPDPDTYPVGGLIEMGPNCLIYGAGQSTEALPYRCCMK